MLWISIISFTINIWYERNYLYERTHYWCSNEIENIYLVEDETLVEKYVNSKNKKRLEGNIYIGKVQNVVSALQAAFVNVGESKNAFIHFAILY